jgi:hypothetical protein
LDRPSNPNPDGRADYYQVARFFNRKQGNQPCQRPLGGFGSSPWSAINLCKKAGPGIIFLPLIEERELVFSNYPLEMSIATFIFQNLPNIWNENESSMFS